jgi:hypothetical protein
MNDEQLIESLGGPARLAELLNYDKEGGVQRVHNWIKRGIPARVKLERPDLFLREEDGKRRKSPDRASASSITQSQIDPYVCGATARHGAKSAGDRPSIRREEK